MAFAVWSDAWAEGAEHALAMLERAAPDWSARSAFRRHCWFLGPASPLGWIGWRGERAFETEPLQLDARAFPEVLAAFGSSEHGVPGFCRSCREALYARRVAQLTRRRPGSVRSYDDVALDSLASVDVEQARGFVATELGPLSASNDQSGRLSATLRVYLEENMIPNSIRAAQSCYRTRSSTARPSCSSRSG